MGGCKIFPGPEQPISEPGNLEDLSSIRSFQEEAGNAMLNCFRPRFDVATKFQNFGFFLRLLRVQSAPVQQIQRDSKSALPPRYGKSQHVPNDSLMASAIRFLTGARLLPLLVSRPNSIFRKGVSAARMRWPDRRGVLGRMQAMRATRLARVSGSGTSERSRRSARRRWLSFGDQSAHCARTELSMHEKC